MLLAEIDELEATISQLEDQNGHLKAEVAKLQQKAAQDPSTTTPSAGPSGSDAVVEQKDKELGALRRELDELRDAMAIQAKEHARHLEDLSRHHHEQQQAANGQIAQMRQKLMAAEQTADTDTTGLPRASDKGVQTSPPPPPPTQVLEGGRQLLEARKQQLEADIRELRGELQQPQLRLKRHS